MTWLMAIAVCDVSVFNIVNVLSNDATLDAEAFWRANLRLPT